MNVKCDVKYREREGEREIMCHTSHMRDESVRLLRFRTRTVLRDVVSDPFSLRERDSIAHVLVSWLYMEKPP